MLALASTVTGGVFNSGSVRSDVIGMAVTNGIVQGDVVNSGRIHGGQYGLALTGVRVGGSVRSTGRLDAGSDALRVVNTVINGDIATQGTITSAYQGIELFNGRLSGSLINEADITAPVGILVNSTVRGSLINRGHIVAASSGVGLYNAALRGIVQNTGSISLEGGVIQTQGPQAALGIHLNSRVGGLYNSGSITSSDRTAVQVDTASVGTKGIRNAGGLIRGRTGLFIDNARVVGPIVNTGTITGTGEHGPEAAVRVRASQLGAGLSNAGTIASGAAAISLDNSGLAGNLASSGQLTGAYGMRLEDSNVDGSVVNSGSIRAEVSGVVLINSEVGTDLVNTGDLFGTGHGIRLSDSTVLGTVRTSGTLGAHTYAMRVDRSYLKGGIVNTGRIEAPAGVSLGNSRVASFQNRGVIQGGDDGTLTIASTVISGGLYNSGALLSGVTSPFTLLLLDSQVAGPVVNNGMIAGQTGITLRNSRVAGGIEIAGPVLADAASGYAVAIDSSSSVPQLRISGNDTARFNGAVRAPATPVVVTAGSTFTLQDGNRFEVPRLENRGTLGVAAQGASAPEGPAHAAVATIAGDYLQAPGATFTTAVASGSEYGQLVVTGTATLPHLAKLYVDVANPAQPLNVSQLANVITAGTLVSDGTYQVTSNSQLFTFSGVKDANTLDLTLAAKSASGATDALEGSPQAKAGQGAAQVLDRQFARQADSALATRFLGATSRAQVAQAVTQSLPLSNALPASQFMLEQITDGLRDRTAEAPQLGQGWAQPAGVWIKPFSGRMANNQRSVTNTMGGTLVGAEAALSRTSRLGLAFAYANSQASDQGTAAGRNSQLELYQLAAYGSHMLDDTTELSLHGGMGLNQSDGRRALNLDGGISQASAKVNSQVFTTGAALSRRWEVSQTTTLAPAISLDYTRVHEDAYRENGPYNIAPLLLDVQARTTEQLLLGFDTRVSQAIAPGVQFRGKLGVAYDLLDQGNNVTAAFAGAPKERFRTPGSDLGPWVLRGGLELVSTSRSGTSMSVIMGMQTRAGYAEQTGQLRLSVPF